MAGDIHPRSVLYGRFWNRRKEAQARLKPGVLIAAQTRRDRLLWHDYFPAVPGTIVEKMVFAELIRLGVTFFFGPYWGDMPFTDEYTERYRPDFILPEYRIVIEVFGNFWHTVEGAFERDWKRAMMYQAAGYKFYALWEYEIMADPAAAVAAIPELNPPSIRTGRVFVSDREFDPAATLRAAAAKKVPMVRTRPPSLRGKYAAQVLHSTEAPFQRVKRVPVYRTGGFHGLSDEEIKKASDYSEQWLRYLRQLEEYFSEDEDYQKWYRQQYEYMLKWRNWWNRWQVMLQDEWREFAKTLTEYFQKYPMAWRYHREYYYTYWQYRRVRTYRL